MARKFDSRGKSKGKSGKKPWWLKLVRFLLLPPVGYVVLLAIIIVLVYGQRAALTSWGIEISQRTLRLFGWGLVFIVVAVATLSGMIWRRKLFLLVRRWNYWLGGIAFALAAWGILAFFPGDGVLRQVNLGGTIGLGVIGSSYWLGALRILGLIILGIVLVAPKASFHLVVSSIVWLGRKLQRHPAPGAIPQPTPSVPVVSEVGTGEKAVKPMATLAPQELKQVAQEVWKKYGESAELVTVDGWRLPPIDILDSTPGGDGAHVESIQQMDNLQRAKVIEEALASYGVEAKVVQINAGPSVTQFGVEPGWDRRFREKKGRDKDGNIKVTPEEVSKTRVKVDRITSLANDLALALAAPSIRIEAPVPGKSVVGIEVPNTMMGVVCLRSVIESSAFQKLGAKSKLALVLGKGAGGEAVAADLTRMPHLLIAGATGSGKTVCLNVIICCLLLYNTPKDVRFIMIDPKRVELTPYNSIPHLVTPVIVDTSKALSALRWLNQEMDERYQKLARAGARNIETYNKNRQGEGKMPYLVLVIDELADLMMTGFDEVEHILCRLAQLARAVGIHLVVATQRPSVDVVTGLIKANFPTRISFAVTSQVDSRTILDGVGAEKLLGRGDMLYMPTEAAKPKRLQGCFVSDAEVERLVYFWNGQRQEEITSLEIEALAPSQLATRKGTFEEDPILQAARQLAQEHKQISASFLQRRLRIGYPRAARIIDQLEEEKAREEGEV